MDVKDPGHIYSLRNFKRGRQVLRFLKRSGGAIQHEKEWDGLQSQEVIRVLIDRTKYLNDVLPCTETRDAIWHLQMALFMFEVRAWRRKQEKVNRRVPAHDDSDSPKSWRENPFPDVPFNEIGIELLPVGEDGHIIWKEPSAQV